MRREECGVGVRVRYYPNGTSHGGYVGVVREVPWQLGDGSWVTHLHQMEHAYRNGERSTVYAAWVDALELVAEPTIEPLMDWLLNSRAGGS